MPSFASFFISRHALALSLSTVIALTGIVSYGRIGLDRTPNVEFPVLNVSTSLSGASAQTVAQTVTAPLEAQLNTIAGVETLSSSSVSGQSNITVQFASTVNMAEALNDVQSRVSQARRDLPTDAQAPVVRKFDINSSALIWLTLSGPRSELELTSYAKLVQKQLEPVSGVGEVQLRGAAQQVMAVTVNDEALSSLGLTYADIQNSFSQNHLNLAGGKLDTQPRQYQVELDFEMQTPKALSDLAITNRDGRAIRLSEVATVEQTLSRSRGFARFDGQRTLSIGVVKASGANPVELLKAIESKLEVVKQMLPADVELVKVSDDAGAIEALVDTLKSHLVEGTLLTALVVWLFLKSVRATTIVATAIPVSLLGAVAVLYFFGYTFNSFTLLALLLLIGVVVDDAIVVLENICQTHEHHPEMSSHEAAEKGTSEVFFAVMASTLTLVCVFGPVIFLPGVIGQFFQSFAVTVVAGVLVSWFVSLTLTPMLCAKFLRHNNSSSGVYAWLERQFVNMERGYLQVLTWCLNHRRLTMLGAAASLVPALFLLSGVKSEFSPVVDEGRVEIRLDVAGAQPKETLLELATNAEQVLRRQPEVQGVLTTFNDGGRSGSDSLSLTAYLKEERTRGVLEMVQVFSTDLAKQPGWRARVSAGSSGGGGGGGGGPLQFYLMGPDNKRVQQLSTQLLSELERLPSVSNIRTNQDQGLAQLVAKLDPDKAAQAGVSARAIASAVAAYNGQATLGRYTASDGERYDVVLQSKEGLNPQSPDALSHIQVRSSKNTLVPLSELVTFETQGAAVALQRVNQQYAVTFSGSPAANSSLGQALADINEAKSSLLPAGYSIQFSGQAAEFAKMGPQLATVLGAALLLLYLVLASQFNSFAQPLVVMLAQPLAVIGGLGALMLSGQSLNIYSVIGLVLLVGLVAKNSILLVDRTNQLVLQGVGAQDALLKACPQRLRPVLMTSLTLILAMLPAALGFGAGVENNQPLAVVIIGGMVSSTLLTLVVVPAAYLMVSRWLKVR